MKTVFAVLGLVAVAAIAIADGPDDRGDVAAARTTYKTSCAACHFVPDPAIERDRVWLGLIKTTA